MLIRSNACVIMFLSNQCFIKPFMFELIAVNVLQRLEKLNSRSRSQVLEQNDWKLSLKIKSNEYSSEFPLIFQFPLNVLRSYNALIKSAYNSGLYRIYKHSYFLFFFPAYNLSLSFCQLSEYFYKMKVCKISCRKVKISILPGGGIFQFSARGERYVYLKKNYPRLKFYPKVNFTSPTCNMPLRIGLEKCLDYRTEVRLILRYIGLRLP